MPFELPDTPESCARCGAPAVVPIVYGLPGPELEHAAFNGHVELGGCIVPQPHRWCCHGCGFCWPLPEEVLASELVHRAFRYAAAVEEAPYLEHPVEVAHMLWEEGYGEVLVAAALLHDLVEHCNVGLCELGTRFGDEVTRLVDALTDDRSIRDYEKRKLVQRARVTTAGRRAAAIFAADRVATVRELRAAHAGDPDHLMVRAVNHSPEETIVNAERDVRMLERFDPPLPFVEALVEQVAGLRADLAARRRRERSAGVGPSGPRST